MEWMIDNKEWFFSGVGVFILGLIISFFSWLFRKKHKSDTNTHVSMKQKGGKNSNNYQSNGDITINLNAKNDDKR